MPEKQIFYDPQRKRWKRLRRILDASAVALTLVVVGVIFNTLRGQTLPELLFPIQKHNYKALSDRTPLLKGIRPGPPARRKSTKNPSQITLNTGEGLRAVPTFPMTPPATHPSNSIFIRSTCSLPRIGCTSTRPIPRCSPSDPTSANTT